MNTYNLIYPMFAMVLLTFVLLVALFRSRVKSVRKGEISVYFYKTYQGDVEPDATLKLTQHIANIFEAPTLFYVVCVVAMVLGEQALAFQFLAWAYVLLRVIHAYIHTGSNKLKRRMIAYFSSWIVLLIMWAYLVVVVSFSS